MANKVDMGEVHEMSKSIKKALNQLHSETETLSNNIDALNDNPDFKGETANSIESYNNNFHKETINRLNIIKKKFESSLNNSIKAFHNNVDEDHKAKLDASAISDYKTDIEKPVKKIEETKGKVNDKVNSVSDLTSASPIHSHEVQEKLGNFTKHIDDTLNDLSDFSASHEGDDLDLAEMIIPVSTMTSKVKDMASNRATIAGVGNDIKSQYKMADKNNPITQFSEQLEDKRSLLYGGKKSKELVKSMLQLKNALIASSIAGNGDISKGNKILSNKKSLSKLSKKELRLINANLKTNLENVQGKKLLKAAKFMFSKKGDLSKSQKLKSALKMTRNFSDKELNTVLSKAKPKMSIKNKTLKGVENLKEKLTFKEAKKLFSKKGIKDFSLKQWKEFKGLNSLGKVSKVMKYGSKALGPLGGIVSIAHNFNSKKSLQKKFVDSAVDLGALGASSATGAAIGTAIGGPIGTAVGAGVGALVGLASETKIKNNKSIKDYAKDKANKKVNDIRKSFNDKKNKVQKQYTKVSKIASKGLIKNSAKFGKSISHVF